MKTELRKQVTSSKSAHAVEKDQGIEDATWHGNREAACLPGRNLKVYRVRRLGCRCGVRRPIHKTSARGDRCGGESWLDNNLGAILEE